MVMAASSVAAFLAGGVVGYVLKPGTKAELTPIQYNDLISRLIAEKPVSYEVIELSGSEARNEQVFTKAGDFLVMEHYPSSVDFMIRMNELEFPQLNLSKHAYIVGPFYRFFISNLAGNGNITLKVCRGIQPMSREYGVEELANRIIFNTPMSHDGRGQLLWADNFEAGLNKWSTLATGTGASVALTDTKARAGQYSVLCTVGNAENDKAGIIRFSSYPILSRLGFEIAFAIPEDMKQFVMNMRLHDGTDWKLAQVTYDMSAETLGYTDSAGNTVIFASNVKIYPNTMVFHVAKLVVDYTRGRYCRFVLDNQEFDLRSYSYYQWAAQDYAHLENYAYFVNGTGGTNLSGYLETAVITQNEP